MRVKALGQTIKKDGEVMLVVGGNDMPPDCMVIFIDLEEWEKIKKQVEITPTPTHKGGE